MGGGFFNLLNRNINDFNKILLSLGGVTFIFLMGLLSYKINTSYAYYTSTLEGKQTIEMTYTKPNLDESGANDPLLSSNMIPVYYDETNSVWKKADKTNSNETYKWYDYDNKMWANAVTVTETNRSIYLKASAGTTIPMDDINTMWVWIPRYTYTYLNTNTPEEIQIKFEEGTNSSGTISCSDTATGESSTSETCTDSKNGSLIAGTSTYTHPAFWWDKDDDSTRDFGEELTGIWVGKFEVSSDTTCTASKNVAVDTYCNLQTIRPKIIPNVTSWRGAMVGTFYNDIYNMRESSNQYGFSTSDETHMMKNMEWGAVTYLSHSKYGINKEVQLNSYSSYMTGCGPQSDGSTSSGSTCNAYNTTLGKLASTTGNIYGIYDMSGGAFEYVMGDLVSAKLSSSVNPGGMMSGYTNRSPYYLYYHSGFTGYLYVGYGWDFYTGTYSFPNKRYYDKYSFGEDYTEYTRGKLGDATKEMAPTGTTGNWYSDRAGFPSLTNPWFKRGGYYGNGSDAGLFHFIYQHGLAYENDSSRAVISNLS